MRRLGKALENKRRFRRSRPALSSPRWPSVALRSRSSTSRGRRAHSTPLRPHVRRQVRERLFVCDAILCYDCRNRMSAKTGPGQTQKKPLKTCNDVAAGCAVSPFEVSVAAGKWVRANFTIVGETVTLQMPGGAAALASTGVRYAWATAPTCMVYNGAGAPGTGPNGTQPAATPGATGIAGTPFCWTGTAPCPVV
jgi:hypothetical protein